MSRRRSMTAGSGELYRARQSKEEHVGKLIKDGHSPREAEERAKRCAQNAHRTKEQTNPK